MLHYKFHESSTSTNQLLVMLHGFISDQSTYDAHLTTLTQSVHVLCIDLPGHGKDQSSMDITWNFEWIASQLQRILSQYHAYHIYLQGYSMGARVALYYAIHNPTQLSGLILESGSPGIQDEDDRQARVQVDRARANVLKIAGLTVFVNDWEKLPLFASQQQISVEKQQAIRQSRLSQDPQRLAKALVDYGTGMMPNLWPELSQLRLPTQIIVGTLDEKFVSIAQKMKAQIPHAVVTEVQGIGHTVHVEDEQKFDTIILDFILNY